MKNLKNYMRAVSVLSLVLVFCAELGGSDSLDAPYAWFAPAAAAGLDEPRPTDVTPGLMWNRSGLPAVFPLQVKTSAGKDYFLSLIDTETGKDTLAAFIIGGDFFKVLVPPGTFVVRFAAGNIWQGETRLFGFGTMTTVLVLEQPLTFKITGPGRKTGHLVDLTDNAPGQLVTAEVKGQSICQAVDTKIAPLWEYWYFRETRRHRWENNRYDNRKTDRALGHYRYTFPEYIPRRVTYPRYTVRSRFCG